MSKLEVDKIDPQSGTALEIGSSGDTITIPSGATLDASNATTTLPANVVTTDGTQTLTNKSIAATQLTGTITPSDGTVTNAKVNASAAIDYSKLNLTGNIALADLSATGTKDATTFLRGDNSFATPDSGLTLIKETNASNVASVSFVHGTSDVVFDSTYKVYFCTFTNILLASDEELFLRILSGGSAQSGSTSYWTGLYGTYGSPTSPNAFNDRYENALWGSPGDVESTIPVSGYVYFYNVGQSSAYPMAMGQMFMQRSNGNHYAMNFSGYYKTAISNFDGFTLTNNGGGNISSGNFKLYGVK